MGGENWAELDRRQLRIDAIEQSLPEPVALVHRSVARLSASVSEQTIHEAIRAVAAAYEPLRCTLDDTAAKPRWIVHDSDYLDRHAVATCEQIGHAAGPRRWLDVRREGPARFEITRCQDRSRLLSVFVHSHLFDQSSCDRLLAAIAWYCETGTITIRATLQSHLAPERPGLPGSCVHAAGPGVEREDGIDAEQRLELPALRVKRARARGESEAITRSLPAQLVAAVEESAALHGVGYDIWVSAAVYTILSRLSGQTRFWVERIVQLQGPLDGLSPRSAHETELVDATGAPTFVDLVGQIRGRRARRPGAPDVHLPAAAPVSLCVQELEEAPLPEGWAFVDRHDLHLESELRIAVTRVRPGSMQVEVVYDPALFDDAYATGIAEGLENALQASTDVPVRKITLIDIANERVRIGALAPGTESRGTISGEFESRVRRSPDATALLWDGGAMSYRELDQRANGLAWRIRELGLGREDRVAICAAREPHVVAWILGILKAGCCYVPIDPTAPGARIELLLSDSRARAVLARGQEAGRPWRTTIPVIDLDDESGAGAEPPRVPGWPDQTAYLLYSSGSTGSPKGVMGTHRGILDRMHWMWRAFPFQDDDVLVQKAPLAYGDSLWELFGGLLQGVATVCARDEDLLELTPFMEILNRYRVTRLVVVPSYLRVLMEAASGQAEPLHHLRLCVSSGDVLTPEIVRAFRAALPHATLLNLYGSVEVAADVACYDATGGGGSDRVPIGRPLPGVRLLVLDGELRQVPTGIPGQLYVSGHCLARGYSGAAGATAARFLPDADPAAPGERMFRTGDQVRWNAQGDLEYFGRLDHQVKVNGRRVELEEIESALRQCTSVADAVVSCVRLGDGPSRLVAFVRARPAAPVSTADLDRHLRGLLPEYMMPTHYRYLSAFPEGATGKVDRRRLADQAREVISLTGGSEPVHGELEKDIADIWCEVLGLESVGRYDELSLLGGDSLTVMRMSARIRSTLKLSVSPRTIAKHPTVESLARAIRAGNAAPLAPLPVTADNAETLEQIVEQIRGGDR